MLWVLLTILLALFYYYWNRNLNYWEKKNVPFVKPLPFVGNMLDGIAMKKSMGELFQDLYNKTTAPFLGFFLLNEPALLIKDLDLITKILVTDFKYFDDRFTTHNIKGDPIGSHILFFLKNPLWKDVRLKIAPAFSTKKIRLMFDLLKESAESLTSFLSDNRDSFVDVIDISRRFSVDVLTTTSFGVKIDCFQQRTSVIMDKIIELYDPTNFVTMFQARANFLFPVLVKLFNLKILNSTSTEYLKKVFLNIMNERAESNVFRNDLIDTLLELQKDKVFDSNVLIAQAFQFVVAGFETVGSSLTYALFEISKNSEIQTKLKHETDRVLKKYGELTYQALKEMTYLDQCIKETLRKYPPAPFMNRVCTQKYNIPNTDITIEKGTKIFISLLALHNDPQYYSNPEIFDPNRFEDRESFFESTYLPFGHGPRYCIGDQFALLAAKTALAYLFQKFSAEIGANSFLTVEKKSTFLTPTGNFKLRFYSG